MAEIRRKDRQHDVETSALKNCGLGGRSRKNILELVIANEEGTSFPPQHCGAWGVKGGHQGGLREHPWGTAGFIWGLT